MWSNRVVVFPPLLDDRTGIVQIQKCIPVQTVIAELAVEAFAEGILCRLAWLDENMVHIVIKEPAEKRFRCKLGTIVTENHFGFPPNRTNPIKYLRYAIATDPTGDFDPETFLCAFVDQGHHLQPSSIHGMVKNKVCRDCVVLAAGMEDAVQDETLVGHPEFAQLSARPLGFRGSGE